MASKKRYHAVLGLDEHCVVCGRVQFGLIALCGYQHWRHESCVAGSVSWCDAYVARAKKYRTPEGDIFLKWAQQGRQA